MIRSHLVKALYQNLLGPLYGPKEIIEEPFLKYELGILNSSYSIDDDIAQNQSSTNAEINPNVAEIKQEIHELNNSENTQGSENLRQEVDTELNLKSGALSLGLSFVLEGAHPKFQICLTWARYVKTVEFGSVPNLFMRKPNFFVTDWIDASKKFDSVKLSNDVNGSIVTHSGVFLHVITKKIEHFDKWTVQIFLENKSEYDVTKSQSEVTRIFQPQIRVKSENELLDLDSSHNQHTTYNDDLLYHNLRTKARGYLCAAVWNDVDPEKNSDGDIGKISWPDSEIVPEKIKSFFTCPDVRTEYLPLYSILQPDQSDKPIFNANTLSQTWKSTDIKSQLSSIEKNYTNWIDDRKKTLDNEVQNKIIEPQLKEKGESNLRDCYSSRDRIKHGIDFLIENKKARAAFCFMNAVMNDKRVNETKNNANPDGADLEWREFQMAFILQSLKGVSGESKDERDLSDVLWFPTGGGKTEAYLGIVIFTLAFRRLSIDENQSNEGGVNVISRYTLRLLTIQQFQRALGAIVAADLRRVRNWLPSEAIEGEEKISDPVLIKKRDDCSFWGNHRFSIGMWIGSGITPKDFAITTGPEGKKFLNCEGALRPQWHKDRRNSDEDSGPDPAQVQNCPVCKNILCIPREQKEYGSPKKLTWIICSPHSLEILQKITKEDIESQNQIALRENPEFELLSKSTDGFSYYRLTMELLPVRKNQVLDRTLIDSWWNSHVKGRLDPDDDRDPLESTSPSMPGYFFLHHGHPRPHDFAIFCTNKSCELNKKIQWFEKLENQVDTLVPKPFQIPDSPHLSISVPISAYVSDEQVYAKCPSFLIATADKFANLPFEPRCASLFGNVDVLHRSFGYGRRIAFTAPLQNRSGNQRIQVPPEKLIDVRGFNPPSLILQDELHLIEGPLGSMVGIYEMAVDVLSNNGSRPKYIASSATIKEAETQVGTIFRRKISIFPPPGIDSFDNYFSKIEEDIPCTAEKFGRLYLGISSTKSTVYLPIKAQSIIMSEIFKIRNNPDNYDLNEIERNDLQSSIDPYWTFVSYFTDLQLLSKFTDYYPENIIENVSNWSNTRVSNSLTRLPNKPIDSGLKLFPLISDRELEVSSISIFCANKIGKIKIALYRSDNPVGKLIYSSEFQDCRLNENIFDLAVGDFPKINKGEKIWVSVISTDPKTIFQLVEITEDSLEDKTFEPTTENFPTDFKELSSIEENFSIKFTLNSSFRLLTDEKNIQLSSETKPEDLTKNLEQLQSKFLIDSLQTSPVFGTGIDVDRLGVMQIMNQPKTNSGYIQSSGRVGRSNPGLVISWLRAGRARDLNHYENFIGYHRMLHKFVEPVTASPFSDEAMRLCLGPILVAILINARNVSGVSVSNRWVLDSGPDRMREHHNDPDVESVKNALSEISKSNTIADYRKMPPERFEHLFNELKGLWHKIAKDLADDKTRPFTYHERRPNIVPENNVVLGTPNHKDLGLDYVYDDTPNSLRQTESSSVFYGPKNDITQIRPSQFTTRYGPGTLISGKKSTWVIPPIQEIVSDLKDTGNFEAPSTSGYKRLYKYEINDSRMKRLLHRFNSDIDWQKLKLFSLPTNSSLTVKEFQPLYRCNQFPRWAVCHNKVHPSRRILAEMTPAQKGIVIKCPACQEHSDIDDEKSTQFFNARYVLACCNGHLDDVNWQYEIHRSGVKCGGNVFEWVSSGSNDDAEIVCLGHWDCNDPNRFIKSTCKSSATYLELKGRSKLGQMDCSAKFAETGLTDPDGCPRPIDNMSQAKMISKTQMSLRMPIVATTMEIQKHKGILYEMYEPLASSIVMGISMLEKINPNWTKNDFLETVLRNNRGSIRGITNQILRQTENASENMFREVIEAVKKFAKTLDNRSESLSEYDSLNEELISLENLTLDNGTGAQISPDDPEPDMRFPIQFETSIDLNFEAMPFGDIKVTQVQTGYTREISPPTLRGSLSQDDTNDGVRIGKVISSNEKFVDENDGRWYLGNQSRGEGIFIHLDPKVHEDSMDVFNGNTFDDLKIWESIHQKILEKNTPLLEKLKQEESNEQQIDALEKENMQSNPLFVWWHSFAHELINQLSIDSGFMGVSLGERIYCIEKQNGTFGSGIFIYVSSPGADGTLGGLTSLVNLKVLQEIIEKTLQKISTCSNDPVCSERKINLKRRTGAACHICLMNSETSCAYQNKFLDRNLIRGTL